MDGKYTVNGIRYSKLKLADAARAAQELKRCPKCGQVRGFELFPADRSRTDGLHPHCKPCLADHRNATREQRRAYERERYRRNRARVLSCLPLV